jgi:hypothetical protein
MSTITPRDEANIGREIVPHDENPVVKDPEKSENRIK